MISQDQRRALWSTRHVLQQAQCFVASFSVASLHYFVNKFAEIAITQVGCKSCVRIEIFLTAEHRQDLDRVLSKMSPVIALEQLPGHRLQLRIVYLPSLQKLNREFVAAVGQDSGDCATSLLEDRFLREYFIWFRVFQRSCDLILDKVTLLSLEKSRQGLRNEVLHGLVVFFDLVFKL